MHRIAAVLAAFVPLLITVPSYAQAKSDSHVPSGAVARLHTSGGAMILQSKRYNVISKRLSFEPWIKPTEELTLRPFVRLNSTGIELKRPDKQPFDATLDLPWQTSFGIGGSVRVLQWRWLDVSLYGEMDMPASSNTARVSSLMLHDEGSTATKLDIDPVIVRDHVDVRHEWKRFDIGLTLQANLGIWHPFIDGGYVHMPGKLTLSFDKDAGAVLEQFKSDPKPSYDAGISSPFYSVGLDVDVLQKDLTLRARVTAAPTSHGWLATGELGFITPIDLF